MKPVYTLLLLCLAGATASGQTFGSLIGKVVDSLSRRPTASATIILHSTDSVTSQTVMSDSLGVYTIVNYQLSTIHYS
jgi:hypothetical protein